MNRNLQQRLQQQTLQNEIADLRSKAKIEDGDYR